MKKLVIVTYVLRALGFVLVLLMLFGHSIVLNLFPSLEGHSINPIFYTGIVCYATGAVIHFFIKKKAIEFFIKIQQLQSLISVWRIYKMSVVIYKKNTIATIRVFQLQKF